jgi:hypothetical protein
MRVISKTNASFIEYPPNSGTVYEPEDDGVFDLPEPVARELARKHASHWVLEAANTASMSRDRAVKLRNPRVSGDAIARLEDRVAELEAWRAEIETYLDEPEQTRKSDGAPEQSAASEETEASDDAAEDPEPAGAGSKPARTAKPAARGARQAAKKTEPKAPIGK